MVGYLTNDPNHDRYSTAQIDQQLENVQNRWNVSAGILVDSSTITIISGTRQYALTGLTGVPIAFRRATFKGLELLKRSKTWFDLYSGTDWTLDLGTPQYYYIDTDADGFMLALYPTPQDVDAGANLVVEYVKQHTPMVVVTDAPFNALTYLTAYHYGIAYEVAANLLAQDPDPANQVKIDRFQRMGNNALADLTQVFKAMEKEEPMRLSGGRSWRF
jgi:hypothetical protein